MNSFKNTKISKKLFLAFSSIIFLMIVIAIFSIDRLGRLNSETNFMVNARMASVREAGEMSELTSQLRLLEFRLATSPENDAEEIRSTMTRVIEAYDALDKTYPASIGDSVEQSIYDRVKTQHPAWMTTHALLMQLVAEGRRADAMALANDEGLSTFLAVKGPLGQLVKHNEDRARSEADESNYTFSSGRLLIGLGTVIATILAISLSRAIARGIALPLKDAVQLARAVAAGDLTRSLYSSGHGEVGDLLRAFEAMRDNLVKMLTGMRESSDSVATASAQIASGSADLSGRTEQTAARLQETAFSMEELASTASKASEATMQACELAQAASKSAMQGGEIISQVIETMRDIGASSQKISEIIGAIDSIAFQTNILALNAAVEAARAGENGRGFAVVASEVRSLAQHSAASAKEIKSLIHASVEKVESGLSLVSHAGFSMNKIEVSTKQVADIVVKIGSGAILQKLAIDKTNSAVKHLDRMTQGNAALVEESAAAADSLKNQAARLFTLVELFRLKENQQIPSTQIDIFYSTKKPKISLLRSSSKNTPI